MNAEFAIPESVSIEEGNGGLTKVVNARALRQTGLRRFILSFNAALLFEISQIKIDLEKTETVKTSE